MPNHTNKRLGGKGWFRPLLVMGLVAGAAFAGGWFFGLSISPTQAAPPAAQPAIIPAAAVSPVSSDYARRVVARIHGTEDITREELGEYLIARCGAEKLELLVNLRIIEHACREKGIAVSDAEVESALDQDCAALGVDRKTFINSVLRQYKKTVYEWKEDVIRPRLMLTKYCRDRVQVGDDDLRQAFEAKYGEKVEVRVLMYPHDMLKAVYKIYEQVRHTDDESEAERKARDEEFERAARSQPNAQLAANGGKVPPISRYSGDDEVERVAFSLRPGEVSSIIHTKEALLILKCIKRIGPDRTKLFENEREALKREVFDQKIQKEIGEVFKELSAKAQPVRYLRESESMADLERAVRQELQTGPLPGKPGGK